MGISRRVFMWALVLLGSAAPAGRAAAAEPELTFFGWSDQHVTTDGNAEHVIAAVDAMNRLPGREFPPSIGGKVAQPALVLGCGDVTEWPTRAARDAYDRLITKRLKFPAFDLLGNHDEGGKAPSRTMFDWIKRRQGSPSYKANCF